MKFHNPVPPAGPYSQGVEVDGWLYTSGQLGTDASGELVPGGFEAQARQALANVRAVLASAGCTFSDVVRAGLFVTDLENFPILNALYAEAMGEHRPARTTVQVVALPKKSLVEMEVVARIP